MSEKQKVRVRVEYQREWYELHKETHRETQKQWHQNRKLQVILAYGGKCACCGETEIEFLAVDHINNDGAAHRKKIGHASGSNIHRWLIRNNFPEGFQVLCHNCNFSKHFGKGVCVHQRVSVCRKEAEIDPSDRVSCPAPG